MNANLRRFVDESFAVDLRSLAAFRIALASVFLFDLATRSVDLRSHYTDAGVLPIAIFEQFSGSGIWLSAHVALSHLEWGIIVLFLLASLSGLALLLGYKTRLATLACWFFLASIHVRNPYLGSMGGDRLLQILLTWSLLVPLGARFSRDASQNRELRETSNRLRSIPAAGLLLQVCLVYWVTGLKKNGATWVDGSAVYYALHLDYWTTSIGAFLREQVWLLPFSTYATRWFEILGPFLAFSPIYTAQLRLVTIGLFAGFHLILALGFHIGMFPLVSMVGWLAFLPTLFWDRVLPESRESEPGKSLTPSRSLRTGWISQAIGLVFLGYIVSMLAIQLGWLGFRIPEPIEKLTRALRIHQTWSMFSPDPSTKDIWPVIKGTLESGDSVDLFRGTPVTFKKPKDLSGLFPNFRWKLYFDGLSRVPAGDRRLDPTYEGLAHYLCEEWNALHFGSRRAQRVQISWVVETTQATYEERPKVFPVYKSFCRPLQPSFDE